MKHEDDISGSNVSSWKTITLRIFSGFFIVLAGYFFYHRFLEDDGHTGIHRGPPPAVVTAATAKQQIWRSQLTTVGTIQAVQGIDVTTEIAGKVAEIVFKAGAYVETGDLLVKLDTSTERAELRALEARLEKARSDEIRALQLVDRGFISEAGLQQATTETKNLQAQAEQQRTLIRKKTIRAPFAGRLGIRQISPGELISPGTPIVTLQSISPIFVNFTLPEHTYAKVAPGQHVEVSVTAYPDTLFKGEISAINPKVSDKTRNFTVQALAPNHEGLLQPGMFADITIDLGAKRPVIAIPVSAVTFNAYGESVFFVRSRAQQSDRFDSNHDTPTATNGQNDSGIVTNEPDRRPVMIAERAFIRTGEKRGLMAEVVKGVKAGDRVITAGQIKISDGSPVILSNEDIIQDTEPVPTEP